jgi:hypothetical protein
MILKYDNVDIERLSDDERKTMNEGLCPKCRHDTFREEPNLLSLTNNFLKCNKCDYISSTHLFRPKKKGQF